MTDVPGTTRDLVTEIVDLDGLRVTLVDTAGLARQRPIRSRSKASRDRAGAGGCRSCVMLIVAIVQRPTIDDREHLGDSRYSDLIVANKIDLPPAWRDARRGRACRR